MHAQIQVGSRRKKEQTKKHKNERENKGRGCEAGCDIQGKQVGGGREEMRKRGRHI